MEPAENMNPAVELRGVVKTMAGKRILDRVDLTVPRGAITVLLGPSGAGKTVTIKHILGLTWPSAGTVKVEGRDLARISEEEMNEMRRGMSAVLQGALPFTCGLFYSLTVYENVAFPLRERTRMSEQEIDRMVLAHLGMVGLRDNAESMPDQLSAGMVKRVALARTLALDARLVVIDDFDSGIDGVRLALLCEMIQDAQRDSGATYLVTTHDMNAARRLADHVAVINNGRIVGAGTAEEMFESKEPVVEQLISGARSGPIGLGAS
ncbi:MAG: ABC transporter ATP-binding protein [Solirubrobacterales bacterium]